MTTRSKSRWPSPKLIAPIVAAVSLVANDLILTGDLNRPALAAAAVAVLGIAGAYFTPPGAITNETH